MNGASRSNNINVFSADVFDKLLQAVLTRATHRESMLHGEAHWRAVTYTALELAPLVAGADVLVGFLFGLMHDSQRVHDGNDVGHGPRAAELARVLHGEGFLPVSREQLDLLMTAMHGHTTGRWSSDPTIGLCWDADRLNLWRIGVTPRAEFLSTAAARKPERIAAHRGLPGQNLGWGELHRRLGAPGRGCAE
jgi:uncharacterized protein